MRPYQRPGRVRRPVDKDIALGRERKRQSVRTGVRLRPGRNVRPDLDHLGCAGQGLVDTSDRHPPQKTSLCIGLKELRRRILHVTQHHSQTLDRRRGGGGDSRVDGRTAQREPARIGAGGDIAVQGQVGRVGDCKKVLHAISLQKRRKAERRGSKWMVQNSAAAEIGCDLKNPARLEAPLRKKCFNSRASKQGGFSRGSRISTERPNQWA